jgi:hypothetical protein
VALEESMAAVENRVKIRRIKDVVFHRVILWRLSTFRGGFQSGSGCTEIGVMNINGLRGKKRADRWSLEPMLADVERRSKSLPFKETYSKVAF